MFLSSHVTLCAFSAFAGTPVIRQILPIISSKLLAKRKTGAILRTVSKLTAEMPHAACGLDACRGHHWSVGQVTPGWRRERRHSVLRMPAFFLLSAEFNPDYDDNHDDCNQNAHLVFTSLPQGGRGSVATSDTLGTLPSALLI